MAANITYTIPMYFIISPSYKTELEADNKVWAKIPAMIIKPIKIKPTIAKNLPHLAAAVRFDWEVLLINRSLLKRSRCSIQISFG